MTAPHPSPHRDVIAPGWLIVALASGPGGWIVQLLIGYALASQACDARRLSGAATGPGFTGEAAVLLAANLICLTVVVAGGVFCRWVWNRVAAEKAGGPEAALQVGDGRTRFLAVCGMLLAVCFTIAVAFNTLEPLLVPTCWTGAQ